MKKFYLLILAFTSGLTIMAVEMSASRLMAPYFGTSTFVWTNIIGIIMISLSIGYYLGGKLADKHPRLNFILKTIIIACICLLIIPFIIKPLVAFIMERIITFEAATVIIFVGSLITVSLLFILPIVILGMVSPYIIKLLSLHDPNIGKDAGLVFSISTIGSILGAFLPVLVFIPWIGTRKTIIIFSLILIFICLLGLIKGKAKILALLLITPLWGINFTEIKDTQGKVYETESAYQYIQVKDDQSYRYLLLNEGLGISSLYRINSDNVLTGYYYDYYNILPYISGNSQKQDILILGLAGGIISTQLDHFFSADYDLHIDGVEIDKKVIETAKNYFNLENNSLEIHNLDARNYLRFSDKKYNSIIIDAYSVQHYIPFHLTTEEFFTQVKGALKTNGVVAINVNATSKDSQLLRSISNTMLKVFKNVYFIHIADESWNYMVIASDSDINWKNLKQNKYPELNSVVNNAFAKEEKIAYYPQYDYLTDDKAPVEFMTEKMIIDYIFENL